MRLRLSFTLMLKRNSDRTLLLLENLKGIMPWFLQVLQQKEKCLQLSHTPVHTLTWKSVLSPLQGKAAAKQVLKEQFLWRAAYLCMGKLSALYCLTQKNLSILTNKSTNKETNALHRSIFQWSEIPWPML